MSLGENFCLFLADIRMYTDIVNEMKAFMLISSMHLTKYDYFQLNMLIVHVYICSVFTFFHFQI